MEYWKGIMNWKIEQMWKCETCGMNSGLEWGLVHAQCRCNECHTPYMMRNSEDVIVTTPILQLKDEYKEPTKRLWNKYHKPIDEATDNEWDSVLEEMK